MLARIPVLREAAEPRQCTRAGHIPKSINLPFSDLLDLESGRFKSVEAVRALFSDVGVNHLPVVVSCGSGVTACVLALGLEVAGLPEPKLYDGSWSEGEPRRPSPLRPGIERQRFPRILSTPWPPP